MAELFSRMNIPKATGMCTYKRSRWWILFIVAHLNLFDTHCLVLIHMEIFRSTKKNMDDQGTELVWGIFVLTAFSGQ